MVSQGGFYNPGLQVLCWLLAAATVLLGSCRSFFSFCLTDTYSGTNEGFRSELTPTRGIIYQDSGPKYFIDAINQ